MKTLITRPSSRYTLWQLRLTLGALTLFLLAEAAPAFSQTEPASLRITHIDTELFPEVRLQVAAVDSAADPVDVLASSFALSEDGVPFPISSVAQSEVGVRVIFVAEPG
ncbi:MAG TPA: hypothetical protein VJJ46_10670, partial [Anaerolineales bacterium]|nr:hypothetical protein [Anaerolineales bacterium]